DRREADAAVAHHRSGDPVPAGGCQQRVPGGLAVVVGVDVDETGGDHQAGRIDLAARRAQVLADLDDAVTVDRHVADERRLAGPVVDGPATDDQIPHRRLLARVSRIFTGAYPGAAE